MNCWFCLAHDTPDEVGDSPSKCSVKTCAPCPDATPGLSRKWEVTNAWMTDLCTWPRRGWKSAEISDRVRASGPLGKLYPIVMSPSLGSLNCCSRGSLGTFIWYRRYHSMHRGDSLWIDYLDRCPRQRLSLHACQDIYDRAKAVLTTTFVLQNIFDPCYIESGVTFHMGVANI